MARYWPILALALIGMLAPAARAEDFVVVESSASDVKVGAMVASGAAITVPDKARIVLMSGTGRMVALNGPFKGVPPAGSASGDSKALQIVSTMIGANDQRVELGAVRAADVAWRADTLKTPKDVLAIDVTDGGDACLYDAAAAEVTHNPAKAGAMIIHATDGEAVATVVWTAGTARLPWPKSLPLKDGSTFLTEQPDQSDAALTTIHILPQDAAGSEIAKVAQLAQNGCNDQAKLMLTVLAKAAK